MAAKRKTAYTPEEQRQSSTRFQTRLTPSLHASLESASERYDLSPAVVLEVIHDLARASGRLDAALFAAMVLHEQPEAYERAVGRPASTEARELAARAAKRAKAIMAADKVPRRHGDVGWDAERHDAEVAERETDALEGLATVDLDELDRLHASLPALQAEEVLVETSRDTHFACIASVECVIYPHLQNDENRSRMADAAKAAVEILNAYPVLRDALRGAR